LAQQSGAIRDALLRAAVSAAAVMVAQSGFADPAPSNPAPKTDDTWAISAFAGVLSQSSFIDSFYNPRFGDSYIGGADLTYAIYRLPTVPLVIELDGTVAKRFGQDDQWDFGLIPMFRWTKFPWNDYLYTNFRIGPVGVDYVTGISPWELHWAGNDHGSRWLNYLALELDFRPSATSPFEF
jgi:hypothetical protein